jgi:drug/metabolite transporter (DMT)-like permease
MIAAAMMFAVVKFTNQKIAIQPEDRLRFLLLGFFSFVNVVGAILALNYISATRFAIFQPCIPCIATVISIFMGLEPISYFKLGGIALAVSGAILSEAWKDGNSNDDDEKDVTLGSIIVSIQVTGMACLVVFAKPILPKYNSAVTTLLYYSIGTFYTIILFAVLSFTFTAQDLYFDGSTLPWLGLAYASSFATLYPYNALSWSGRHLSPSTTTVYSTFQPVGTMILSLIILNKIVTTPELVGGALVILGLICTVYGQTYDNLFMHRQHEQNEQEKDLLADHYRIVSSEGSNNSGGTLLGNNTILDQEYHFTSRQVSFTPTNSVVSSQPPYAQVRTNEFI